MDQMMNVPSTPYDHAYGPHLYPPMAAPWPFHMMPTTPLPQFNPIYPDTTVPSGSEFGDTPPSSGSSSNPSKKKFKSPEEEKRYRVKRVRNNEAAKKSRKSRKQKEMSLMEENNYLKTALNNANMEIASLKAQLSACPLPFNGENIPPLSSYCDSKPFQGMSINSMGLHSQ